MGILNQSNPDVKRAIVLYDKARHEGGLENLSEDEKKEWLKLQIDARYTAMYQIIIGKVVNSNV